MTSDLDKCTRCALCVQNCPIYNITHDENNTCRGLICKLSGFEQGIISEAKLKKDLKVCLNCSKCENNCPSKVKTSSIFAYKNAVFYPSKISQRLLLAAKLLPFKILYFLNIFKRNKKSKESNIMYFKGCVAHAQHKTTFLDEYESNNLCCGLPYLTSGDIKNYEKVKKHNIKLIRQKEKIIFDCSSCKSAVEKYGELTEEDRKKLVFFSDIVDKNYKNKTRYKKATFHKPCHMSKDDFEHVENLLNNIENLNYIRLENPDLCCGFGGSYFIFHPLTALKIAFKSASQINNADVDLILTACPSCTFGLRTMQILTGKNKKVLELRDFLEKL